MRVITIEHETDTAHRLSCHKGKCANLHGHRYKFVIAVEVAGSIEDGDLFYDFYDFKKTVRSILDEAFDHATILCENEANLHLLALLEREKQKVYVMRVEPTAEALTVEVYKLLNKAIKPNIVYIKVYETPTNSCTWAKE